MAVSTGGVEPCGGWTLEIEIPVSTLNFDPNAEAWGINFQRTVRRKNEESLWSGWLRNQGLTGCRTLACSASRTSPRRAGST